MTTLALLIAAFFALATAFIAWVGLDDKLYDFEVSPWYWEYYPNPKVWEDLYTKLVSVGLGLLEFAVLYLLFVGTGSWLSLILEVIVALPLGFVLGVFVSQILFCIVIDGCRYLQNQRKKCLQAIARKKQII